MASHKIGLISDIHAHLPELQTALMLLETKGVDEIWCAGDLVEGSTDGDAVVDLIRKRGIPAVRGNHDESAKNNQTWIQSTLEFGSQSAFLLKDDTLEFVSTLPLTRRFERAGFDIVLTHGAPWSNTNYMFPGSRDEKWQRLIDEADADIVLLGHTHTPMRVRAGVMWVLNAGSVSANREGDARCSCGVLTLPELTFKVYNIDTGLEIALTTLMRE